MNDGQILSSKIGDNQSNEVEVFETIMPVLEDFNINNSRNSGDVNAQAQGTPSKNHTGQNVPNFNNVNKSPSDTTIYVSTLKLTPTKVIQDSVAMKLMKTPQNSNGNDVRNPLMREEDGSVAGTRASGVNKGQINQGNDLMKRISDFVEQVRIETDTLNRDNPQPGTSGLQGTGCQSGNGAASVSDQMQEAEQYATNMVLQAEKFHAATELPKGIDQINSSE